MFSLIPFALALMMGYPVSDSPEPVTILFAGDAMQHTAQIESAGKSERYDYRHCFSLVENEIKSADLAVVNLEVPLGGKPYTGYPAFSAPDEYAVALKNAGFDIFLTANNHCLDRRSSKGLLRTIQVLDSIGVRHAGTYRDRSARHSCYPLMIKKKGIRFAFLNYTYGTNGIKVVPPAVVNYIDRNTIKEDIKRARELDADIIVACMHWGEEYKLLPNSEQKGLADMLVEEGVQLVIGGHPHVIQPMEMKYDEYGNAKALVVYSLGNFISNMKTRGTVGGAMVKVTVTKEKHKIKLKSAGYSLIFTVRPGQGYTDNFVIVPADKSLNDKLFPNVVSRQLEDFVRSARNIFSKYNKGVSEYNFPN